MPKNITGIVTSNKADKTIVVTVTSRETHPIYSKQYTVNRKYSAHDETNQANVGDKVTIVETRPISKTKAFKLVSVDEKSRESIELKADIDEAIITAKNEDTKSKSDLKSKTAAESKKSEDK